MSDNMGASNLCKWWFTIKDSVLHFRSSQLPVSYLVKEVEPCKDFHVKVVTENQSYSLPISQFEAVDDRFLQLENVNSRRRFCNIFEELVLKCCPLTEIYNSDGEVEITAVKVGSAEKRSFNDQIEMMRNLHPDSRNPEKNTDFLDSSSRLWRQECSKLFGCNDKATFGGSFREQIYCSCLPQCCYEELKKVFIAFNEGLLTVEKICNGIKAGLFCYLVGVKNEPCLHRLFSRLSAGIISIEQFRKESKQLKRNQKRPDEEILSENDRLKQQVNKLKEEVETLKRKLRHQDVFEFSDSDDTEVIPDINNRPHSSGQRTFLTMPKMQKVVQTREDEFNILMDQIRVEENAGPNEETNETAEATHFGFGEAVEALWGDGVWYDAVVEKVNKKSYRIRYTDDNIKKTVDKEQIRKKK